MPIDFNQGTQFPQSMWQKATTQKHKINPKNIFFFAQKKKVAVRRKFFTILIKLFANFHIFAKVKQVFESWKAIKISPTEIFCDKCTLILADEPRKFILDKRMRWAPFVHLSSILQMQQQKEKRCGLLLFHCHGNSLGLSAEKTIESALFAFCRIPSKDSDTQTIIGPWHW